MPTSIPVTITPTSTQIAIGAFNTREYRNLFKEYLVKSDPEIQSKLEAAWNQLFYGDDNFERVYYPVGEDMAYLTDIGNGDVRTEGMSYGMMIAVQLNKKEEFDRLWKWTKTYMYQKDGGYKGYFAWHCKPDGTPLAANPASDGEEWFIMALMFADALASASGASVARCDSCPALRDAPTAASLRAFTAFMSTPTGPPMVTPYSAARRASCAA